jgi:nucleoside-diphosphate-sugar epimerase
LRRILLTGAAGFIGARTAAQLLEAGDEVLGLDDVNEAYDPRVKRHRLAALEARPGFRFARVDVADRAALASAVAGERFDAVVNLAARAGVRTSVADPWVYVATNVVGTLNLLALCRERAIPKLVLASTSSVYGASQAPRFREDDETSRPLSPYAASKKSAELLAYTWHALHGLDVSVLRYFTVYGPAGRPDMSVFRFVQRIREGLPLTVFGDGSMARDFTYVDDIARGTIAALRPTGYEIVNLGGDHPYSITELVAACERALGRPARVEHAPAHAADVPRTAADIEKARRLFGWEPRVALDEGVAHAAAWYEENRAWAKDVPTEEPRLRP